MRSANGLLNAAGMCCEMTIAGASGGIAPSTSRIASVPPVEAPIGDDAIGGAQHATSRRRGQHGVGAATRIDPPDRRDASRCVR